MIATFQNPGRSASAHFVVEAGRVVQMVDLADTAWHAGDWPINQCSIGIECNPRCSNVDKATVGELIRNLQATYGALKIIGHKDASSTACPGRYYPPAQVLAPPTNTPVGGGAYAVSGVIATCLPPPREQKQRVVSGFCSGQGRMREGR